jgi:PIN domain nuclease of toxin-antitoxin system
MRILLDTHTFYWMVDHPENLGKRARQLIEDPTNELYLSAATIWEISTKHHIGKFPAGDILIANLRKLLDKLKLQTLDMTIEHASISGSLDWAHRDPFDRMLAAQCIAEGLTLASKDSTFADLNAIEVVW